MATTPVAKIRSSIRILLIEDNDISRQLMSHFLTDCGYNVLTLSEASTFTTVMAEFKPDLVLLDLKLPKVDGYTLLEWLQANSAWKKIPIIVVSAFAFNADKQRALDLGARQYLVKPVELNELMEAISAEITCMA